MRRLCGRICCGGLAWVWRLWTVDGAAMSRVLRGAVWTLGIVIELSHAWLIDRNSPDCSELLLWAKAATGYEFQQPKPFGEWKALCNEAAPKSCVCSSMS